MHVPFPSSRADFTQFLNATLEPLLFSGIPGDPNSLLFRELSVYVSEASNLETRKALPDLVVITKLIDDDSSAKLSLLEKLVEYPQFLDLAQHPENLLPTLQW